MNAAALRVGGLQPFSTVDWPGCFAGVVFVQGCPWRCSYCHNAHLQGPEPAPGAPTWPEIRQWLQRRQGLLDAIVFSGGEPTMDPALPAAIAEVRVLGFKVGLHTAGMSPRRLADVLPGIDWVGLDIKAPLADASRHDDITGVRGGAESVLESLALLQASGVAFECRTTYDTRHLDPCAIQSIASELASRGVGHYVVQRCRSGGNAAEPADWRALRERLPALEVRG